MTDLYTGIHGYKKCLLPT